jgi:dTDP-4-dehydrorhamnose 3,5-epimerase
MRPDSPTFRHWQGHVIDMESHVLVYVPEGCAHGYQALEDRSEVSYQVSHRYVADAEKGVRWNDPGLGIDWPIQDDVIVSPKDMAWPDFELHALPSARASAGQP